MASPLIQSTISACFLTATSNIAAQCISAKRKNAPYTIDWVPVLQFILYTALNSPPNFLWQEFLESSFPSHITAGRTRNTAHDNNNNDDKPKRTNDNNNQQDDDDDAPPPPQPRLSLRNTAIKFLLDQSLGAAANTLAFSLAMATFQGLDPSAALARARREFWPLFVAACWLWPWVSLLNFAVVRTVQARALVGGLAGVGWGVYLSLVAGAAS